MKAISQGSVLLGEHKKSFFTTSTHLRLMLGVLALLSKTGIEMVVSSESKYMSCAAERIGPQVGRQYQASSLNLL